MTKRRHFKRKKLPYDSFLGKHIPRKINLQYPLYALRNATFPNGAYTLDPSNVAIATLHYVPVPQQLVQNTEFLDMCDSYAMFKINGIRTSFKRTVIDGILTDTQSFTSYPPFVIDVITTSTTIPSQTRIAASDTGLCVQAVENRVSGISKYFAFPYYVQTSFGLPCFGSKTWLTTTSYIGVPDNYSFHVVFGTQNLFTIMGTFNAAVPVGILEIEVYCTFSKPIKLR